MRKHFSFNLSSYWRMVKGLTYCSGIGTGEIRLSFAELCNPGVGHDAPDPAEPDMTQNLDFMMAYQPHDHEPAVYMCDTPEDFCPFCMSGTVPCASAQSVAGTEYGKTHLRIQWVEARSCVASALT